MRPSPPPCRPLPGRVPVVEGGGSEDDGELVGPLGGVAPAPLLGIPEVALRGEAHDTLGEAAPHHEGKVHLARDGRRCNPAAGTCGRGLTIAPGCGGHGDSRHCSLPAPRYPLIILPGLAWGLPQLHRAGDRGAHGLTSLVERLVCSSRLSTASVWIAA